MRFLTLVRFMICAAALAVMQASALAQSSNFVAQPPNGPQFRDSAGGQSMSGSLPLVVQATARRGPTTPIRCLPDGCPPPPPPPPPIITINNEAVMQK